MEEIKVIGKDLLVVDSIVIELENRMMQLKYIGIGQDMICLLGMLVEKLGYFFFVVGILDFRFVDQYIVVFD